MQTVLHISRMDTGAELAVRRAHDAFSLDALDRGIGVERLVAFIGSGFYALEITVGNGGFQEQFHRFLGTPEVTALFAALAPHVHDLPSPESKTAEMPLATAMLLWQSKAMPDATTV